MAELRHGNATEEFPRALSISTVTAVYEMEKFVGETVRSIVGQKLPGDQYVVIDGGSSDGTMDIIRCYADGIDVLVSEPDKGQYHAISKGFAVSTGDIMGWLNADDIYMSWTYAVVREIFTRFPEVEWITGLPSFMNEAGQLTKVFCKLPSYPRTYIRNGWYSKHLGAYLQQESMFWRRSLWEKAGGLDLSLSLAGDFEMWTRFAQHADLIPVDVPLAAFRERPGAQRSSVDGDRYASEVNAICTDKAKPSALWRWIARRGMALRSGVRLLITGPGPAIAYDRENHCWRKIERRRTISRLSFANLHDEWLLRRRRKTPA